MRYEFCVVWWKMVSVSGEVAAAIFGESSLKAAGSSQNTHKFLPDFMVSHPRIQ
jgi:hypothetical protein